MENYKESREKTIREILSHVYEHKSLPQNAHDWDVAAIVKECVDEKFLENVETITCLDGHVRIVATRPFVTKLGLDFLCQTPYEDTADGRHEQLLKTISENTESLEELKRIADAAERRATLAEKEAESAKTEAKKSIRQSRISNVVAVIAAVIAMLSWLVPIDAVTKFFSSAAP